MFNALKLTPKLALVFILFAAVLLVGVGKLAYDRGRMALESAAVAELEAIAGEKQAALDNWVLELEEDIEEQSKSPSMIEDLTEFLEGREGAGAAHDRLIEELSIHKGVNRSFLDFFIVSPQSGLVILATEPTEIGQDRSDRPYFVEGKNDLFVTPIYSSEELQAPAMTISAPVFGNDGTLLGVLAGRLNLDELNTILRRTSGVRLTEDSFLVNASNLLVSQPRFLSDPVVLQQGFHSMAVDHCLEGESGTDFDIDYRNVPVIAVHRWLPERELCLIVAITQEEALAPVYELGRTISWISLAVMVIASVIAWALSRTIVQPVLAMQKVAQRFGRGDLYARLPAMPQDELGILAYEFNAMAASITEKERQIQAHALDLEKRVEERTAELQESEERFRLIVKSAPISILVTDHEGIIRLTNVHTDTLFGYEPGELLDQPIEILIPGQLREGHRQLHQHYLQQPRTITIGLRNNLSGLHKDGHEIPLEIGLSHYKTSQGDYVLALINDISERKKAEDALIKSQKRFQSLIENAPDGIALLEMNGKLRQVTPSTQHILGYSPEEAQGQDPALLTHPDDLPNVLGLLNDLIQNPGKVIRTEYRFQHKDGSWRWLDSTISNLIAEPSVQAIVFNYRDITEAKQAEEIVNSLSRFPGEDPYPVLRISEDGKILYGNPASQPLMDEWGCAVGEVLPADWKKLVSDVIATNSRRTVDITCKEVIYSLIFTPISEMGYVNLYGRDITKSRQDELALREKERLLSEAQRIGHVGSWSYNIPSDTMKFSDEMYRLLDVLPEDFQHNSQSFLSLIYPSDRPFATKWMEDIRLGRQKKELDFRIFCKNGELRYLHCAGAVEFSSDGVPLHFIGTTQDVSEQRIAEIQIRQQLKRLTALSEIDRGIISSFDLSANLRVILSHVVTQLQVDAADVLLLEEDGKTLVYAAGQGFRTKTVEMIHVQLGESHAGRAASEKRMVRGLQLSDEPNDPLFNILVTEEGFVSYSSVPLIVKGEVKGVLDVFHRAAFEPYTEWLEFLETLAGQTAIAIENASLFGSLQAFNNELFQSYESTIEGWSRAMDLRDREAEGHTQRITHLTMELARAMNVDESMLVHIRRGALLHDIGTLVVPDRILLKPGPLTSEEWEIMQKHPEFAYEMLSPISSLKPALPIPYYHHEKWDGTGYPIGLKGEQIPLEARIFAVADVWDALLSERPYRSAWTKEDALAYIREQSGKHFDPQVVDLFFKVIGS